MTAVQRDAHSGGSFGISRTSRASDPLRTAAQAVRDLAAVGPSDRPAELMETADRLLGAFRDHTIDDENRRDPTARFARFAQDSIEAVLCSGLSAMFYELDRLRGRSIEAEARASIATRRAEILEAALIEVTATSDDDVVQRRCRRALLDMLGDEETRARPDSRAQLEGSRRPARLR
jgi:hypothetical protein